MEGKGGFKDDLGKGSYSQWCVACARHLQESCSWFLLSKNGFKFIFKSDKLLHTKSGILCGKEVYKQLALKN